jgi:oxygen-independent coproporphyrinogen-3 oxidase
MTPDDIRSLSAPVPRYTSYPTAPHFHAGVGDGDYGDWLAALKPGSALSLYMHIPFCDTLCWFCGCNTKITQKYGPVSRYLTALTAEVAIVSGQIPRDHSVRHIHWGGGSPTLLTPDDITRLAEATRAAFKLADDVDFAIEVDPRGLDAPRIEALAKAGLTRVSLGVQDFDPEVQAAINRHQSVAETRAVIDGFREAGVTSLNIDIVYGLPKQTLERLLATVNEVIAMRPDRIALFGYAHVPWMKTHQKLIRDEDLPDIVERHRQATFAAGALRQAGYVPIGLDHFALETDAMAKAAADGTLKRNFQGYTVDPADALIGLGASSIGSLPQGYVQNAPAQADYMRRIQAGKLAATRGLALSDDDRMRRDIIERLMCGMAFSRSHALETYGALAAPLLATASELVAEDRLGLLGATEDGFVITERGRAFMRRFAAAFDAYLPQSQARHSLAV